MSDIDTENASTASTNVNSQEPSKVGWSVITPHMSESEDYHYGESREERLERHKLEAESGPETKEERKARHKQRSHPENRPSVLSCTCGRLERGSRISRQYIQRLVNSSKTSDIPSSDSPSASSYIGTRTHHAASSVQPHSSSGHVMPFVEATIDDNSTLDSGSTGLTSAMVSGRSLNKHQTEETLPDQVRTEQVIVLATDEYPGSSWDNKRGEPSSWKGRHDNSRSRLKAPATIPLSDFFSRMGL